MDGERNNFTGFYIRKILGTAMGAFAALLAVTLEPRESRAASIVHCDQLDFSTFDLLLCMALGADGSVYGQLPLAASGSAPRRGTIAATNEFATLQTGEPTFGGRMQATIWYRYTPMVSGRAVIDTFGSNIFGGDFDTVLAVYTGTDFSTLRLVAGNDDKTVPGFETKRSLVAFNTVAGTTYHIQVGGKANAQGDVRLNLAEFPAGGGLSAAMVDGFYNRDYFCPLGAGGLTNCTSASFVLYNSSNKTLTVTASSTLGPGVVAPAAFTLAPNAAVTKTFTFSGFNTATVRTVIGDFTFSGSDGAGFTTSASHHAVITVKAFSQPATLALTATPLLLANNLNADNKFRVRMKNTSGTAAAGCHFRGSDQGWFYARFQRVNSVGVPFGAANRPFNLAPGAVAYFDVHATSGQDYEADPRFNGSIVTDCSNAAPPAYDLRNRFDITATEDLSPASIRGGNIAPKVDLLNVPAGGVSFRFSTVNNGPTADLEAFAFYIRPFGENDPNLLFGVKICRTSAAWGACLAPPADSVVYTATQGATSYFRLTVTPPVNDPGFDPGQRRVYAYFKQKRADGFGSVLVGTHSIAVKKQ